MTNYMGNTSAYHHLQTKFLSGNPLHPNFDSLHYPIFGVPLNFFFYKMTTKDEHSRLVPFAFLWNRKKSVGVVTTPLVDKG